MCHLERGVPIQNTHHLFWDGGGNQNISIRTLQQKITSCFLLPKSIGHIQFSISYQILCQSFLSDVIVHPRCHLQLKPFLFIIINALSFLFSSLCFPLVTIYSYCHHQSFQSLPWFHSFLKNEFAYGCKIYLTCINHVLPI